MTKFFKKISALLLPLWGLGGLGLAYAQSAGDFRTNGAVTFAAATNWQRYNGTAWVAAAAAPTSADGVITIRNHVAQVTSNVTLDQVIVDGTLQVNNGFTLTLADGAGDDLFVRNRLFFQATGVISGAGQLVLGNQAIVQTANVGGLAASITSTNPTLTAGASYWFNGTAAQSTGFTGFASLGNPLHFHFMNTAGITIDRNLTITGTLTANNNVPITIGAGVTSFTANAIYNGGSFNNCVGATISPAFTATGWASPKGVYQSPDSSEPTTEASNIWTNSHKTTAHIYWMQSGSGNNRIVVLKAGSAVDVNAAIDNTTYSANAAFGSGTAIDGGFVVYNGAGGSINVTGLIEGTTYHVAVFEYNQDCGTNRNYKTGTLLSTSFVAEERPFITEWLATADGELTIPTFTGETYSYNVSYRQILPTVGAIIPVVGLQTGNCTISGLTNGNTYEVSITGQFPRIYFEGSTTANCAKIRNIKQWGSIKWTSMENAFGVTSFSPGCGNLNSNALDVPNLSNVTTMRYMFARCSIFNGGNVSNWNTGTVTNMLGMFYGCSAFNQPLGTWNTGAVTNTHQIFYYATNFNQPISAWNTSAITDMSAMFMGTAFNQPIGTWNTSAVTSMNAMFMSTAFNQPIGSWNTGAVYDMYAMFTSAASFNQPIGTWNTGAVTNMQNMFNGTTAFNQPLGTWNTGAVTNMQFMFYQAIAFNQPIGTWNIGAVTNMFGMFYFATAFNQSLANWNITSINDMRNMLDNCGINTVNYDATLIGWAAQNVRTGVSLGSTGRTYCEGAAARSLLACKGWTVSGDTQAGGCTTPSIARGNVALSAFSACAGVASVAQSYLVTGNNLTGDIVITPPSADFEVSQTSATAGFAPTQTLTQSSGVVACKTIWVRQTATAVNGAGGNITITSAGATTQNVLIPTSVVLACPTATVSVTTLSAFSSCSGVASVAQSYTVSGANLSANIVITAPTNFEVSVTSATAGFAGSQTLTQSGGNVAATTVYIRQRSTSPNNASGTVTHTSTGMLTKNVTIPTSTVITGCATITSFLPTSGGVDTPVTITGTNFTGATAVTIGGQPVRSFCIVNATTIKAITSDNITDGNVTVTKGGTASLGGFTAAATVSFNGTITGTSFVTVGGFTVLRVNITPASPTQWRQALRYREVGATTWNNLTFDASATSADIQGVTTNKQYEIYLQTVSSAGQWSNRSAITTSANSGTATFCSPTVASAAGITGTTVTFNWTAQANATRYIVRYWELAAPQGTCAAEQIAGSNKTVYVENGAANNVVVQGLKPNTNYAYDVQVYCGSAVATNRSNVINFTTGSGTACAVPSTVNFGQTTVSGYPALNVTWSGATGVTNGSPKYQLRYKTNAGTNWIYWNTDATSYVMSGLEPNTQYNFQIAVFCNGSAGNVEWSSVYTPTSGAGTACTNVTLGASSPFSTVGGVVGANLVWTGDAITAGRRFFLGYTKDGESFTVWRWIESNGVTVRSDLDFPNLTPSTNYTYDLQAYCNYWNFAGYAIGNPGSFTTGAATSASPLTLEGGIVNTNVLANELVIYPNPSEGEVNIAYQTTQQNGVALTVIDVLGREVYSQDFAGSVSVKLDGKTLPSGVYVAKVTENGKVMTKRFVVK